MTLYTNKCHEELQLIYIYEENDLVGCNDEPDVSEEYINSVFRGRKFSQARNE
jgi:hypothetical protein